MGDGFRQRERILIDTETDAEIEPEAGRNEIRNRDRHAGNQGCVAANAIDMNQRCLVL